jgi:NADPH-dependent glutamate synthase beta subunit-like oxidoreductase
MKMLLREKTRTGGRIMDNETYIKPRMAPNPATPCTAILIDPDLCCGCNSCANVCRIDVLLPRQSLPHPDEGVFPFKAPCESACPAGIDIRKQLALIAQGRYEEALQLIKRGTPLPSVCGRVCPRFCEMKCRRSPVDGAVAINMTKRFVADLDLSTGSPYVPPVKLQTGYSVAVVGSGPAGLSAAYYLALQGHSVSMFESSARLGGILRYGVPDHRLSKEVLDKEIKAVANLCKEVQVNTTFGKDITMESLKKKSFDAIFLGFGAQKLLKLNVEGEDLTGVSHGVEFLKAINAGLKPDVGSTVVVIGGGMVAVDSAQSALRLGAADVTMVALEARDEFPAYEEDLRLAIEEGVKVIPSYGVKKIIGEAGKVRAIELKACIAVYDQNGVFNPRYDESKTFILKADDVVPAIGQVADLDPLAGSGMKVSGFVEVDETFQTSIAGVFAAGDIVTGAKTVIEAITAGHRAAEKIDSYLRGPQTTTPYTETEESIRKDLTEFERVDRAVMPTLAPEVRKHTFDEIELGLSEEAARKEAHRCLACGRPPVAMYSDECWFCGVCVKHCPIPGAIKMEYPLNQRVGWKRKETGEYFRVGMKNPPAPDNRPPVGK